MLLLTTITLKVNESNIGLTKGNSLIAYFALTYGITWVLSIVAMNEWLPFQFSDTVVVLSSLLLHYGPALAAIIIVVMISGWTGVRKMLGRFHEWQVGIHWYLFILLYPIASRLIAVGLDVLLGGALPNFFSTPSFPTGINPLILLILVFIIVFFQTGIGEEIGWRGFALPKLQARYNALTSSLILGVLWAL